LLASLAVIGVASLALRQHWFLEPPLLLIIIRDIMNNFEPYRIHVASAHGMIQKFYNYNLEKNETLVHFYERFQAHCAEMERVGCSQVIHAILQADAVDANNPTDAERAAAFEKMKAMQFINGAGEQYKSYLTELEHAMLNGEDKYPTTLDSAFTILINRKVERNAKCDQ
jgi:hypothetical protein